MSGRAIAEAKDRVSFEPQIKLARNMTMADRGRILKITGGLPQYYRQPELGLRQVMLIDLPKLRARIDFTSVGQKIEDWGYVICIDDKRYSLEKAAVVFRGDSVSFVSRPEVAGTTEELGVKIETITIVANKLSHEIAFYSLDSWEKGLPYNDIRKAANFVDEALASK